jgi:uncharacterized integral membrane protein
MGPKNFSMLVKDSLPIDTIIANIFSKSTPPTVIFLTYAFALFVLAFGQLLAILIIGIFLFCVTFCFAVIAPTSVAITLSTWPGKNKK